MTVREREHYRAYSKKITSELAELRTHNRYLEAELEKHCQLRFDGLLVSFKAFDEGDNVKLSDKDFNDLYAEVVNYFEENHHGLIFIDILYKYISINYPMLPISFAYDLFLKLYEDGFQLVAHI